MNDDMAHLCAGAFYGKLSKPVKTPVADTGTHESAQ